MATQSDTAEFQIAEHFGGNTGDRIQKFKAGDKEDNPSVACGDSSLYTREP